MGTSAFSSRSETSTPIPDGEIELKLLIPEAAIGAPFSLFQGSTPFSPSRQLVARRGFRRAPLLPKAANDAEENSGALRLLLPISCSCDCTANSHDAFSEAERGGLLQQIKAHSRSWVTTLPVERRTDRGHRLQPRRSKTICSSMPSCGYSLGVAAAR